MKLKDRIKLYIFPVVAVFLHKIGFSWERLGASVIDKSVLLAQANSLGTMQIENNEKRLKVFVLTMLPGGRFMLFIESLFALALKKKGHQVTFIIDDNTLPIHALKKIGNEKKWDYQAEYDFLFASKFLKSIELDFIPISKFIDDADSLEYNPTYESMKEASLLKHYKVGVISKSLKDLEHKIKLVEKSITITHYVGEKIAKNRPDLVIMSHGIYSTWGPPFQIVDKANIPILMYGRGKKRHTLKFDWNKTGDSWDVSAEWEKVKEVELTEAQLSEVQTYIESRITHKEDVFVYNFGEKTSKEATIKAFDLDANKPVYTLFTNVLWDAASAQREIAFKNPIDWVIETIQWFNDHPEKQLIVKIHPAEVVIGTLMPFYDIIISRITPNSNIKIIKPKEIVNSWSIYNVTDLGIVHTTTVGMELPLVNKPCIVVSKTHFRDKGFTLDVESKEEYFDLLENFDIASVDIDKNKREALKYAHLLFIRYQIPFNMFFEEVSTSIKGFRYDNIEQYFKNPTFNEIVNKIEKVEKIFNS